MRTDIASELVRNSQALDQAHIGENRINRKNSVRRVTFNLSTARDESNAFEIPGAFKSFYVEDATDVLANVKIKPNSNEAHQSYFKVKQNDSWAVEFPVAGCFVFWEAQADKELTIVFFTDAQFSSGSQVSVTGGGVSIVEGSTLSTSVVDLNAASVTTVLAADSTRKVCSIQNNSGADVWFGGSSVSNTGANLGLKVSAGSVFEWRNTGALYAYSVAGGTGDNGLLIFTEI
jgi:hypothetical protein